MDTPRQQRIALRIQGRVQGVGYRYSAMEVARRLKLTGWVRNTHEGDVEVLAEGDEPALRSLLAWCQGGPPGARVLQVTERWQPADGSFDDFQIRHG